MYYLHAFCIRFLIHTSTIEKFIITLCMYNSEYCICTAAAITFSQSASSIEEDSGFIQLELFLSNPLSANITVELISADGTATGD